MLFSLFFLGLYGPLGDDDDDDGESDLSSFFFLPPGKVLAAR